MLLWLLIACSEPDPSPWFEPAVFYVQGSFAWDASTSQARTFTDDGVAFPPSLTVLVATQSWFDGYAASDLCRFELSSEAPVANPAWAQDAEVDVAIELPPDASIVTDCSAWDPAIWGEDPTEVIRAWTWGLGLGALNEDVAADLEATVRQQEGEGAWEEAWAPILLGGGYHWSGAPSRFAGGFLPNDYAVAVEVDETYALVRDAEDRPAYKAIDTFPSTAAYNIAPWFGVDAALLLPTNL